MGRIEVAFSSAALEHFDTAGKRIVVVDILRATSVICTMLHNGASGIIPVPTIDRAKEFLGKGLLIVAERNGSKLDFADYGNSPLYFTPDVVENRTVVYSTTNGTNAITRGQGAKELLIGSFLNLAALSDKLLDTASDDLLILCAGWKGKFCLEDALFAGALATELIRSGQYNTICDSTNAAIDLWSVAGRNLPSYMERVAQRHRLKKLGLDDVIDYCFTPNITTVIPVLSDDRLIPLNR